MNLRSRPRTRSHKGTEITRASAAAAAHSDSSTTLPSELVVNVAYQDHTSAMRIIGNSRRESLTPVGVRAVLDHSFSNKAHWATKLSSAMVATPRPRAALDNHESYRQMR